MKQFDSSQLGQFTGTGRYYRISRKHLLTDGTRYLAEQAACYWLMDAIASHLSEIDTAEWFCGDHPYPQQYPQMGSACNTHL